MSLSPYYGGRTLDAVSGVVRRLRARGLGACVSLLPEWRLRARGVEAETRDILAIAPGLHARGESADLTVKLSQLGLRAAPDACRAALAEIAARAGEFGSFLWIDMERARDVDLTIARFLEVRRGAANVGLCLQAYLRRTGADLAALMKDGHPVRLVKGYYRESRADRFASWEETTENLKRLLVPLLDGSSRPAVGTHDEAVIAEAERLLARNPRPEFEYQFFLGAKPALAEEVARSGRRARVYIPYGRLFRYFLHTAPQMDVSRNVQRLLRRPVIR